MATFFAAPDPAVTGVVRANKDMCLYCFGVLASRLLPGGCQPTMPPSVPTDASCALFVTWHAFQNGREDLRGCIGTHSPGPLPAGLRDFALESALKDSRFPPIAAHELPHLSCEVSLLSQFEECAHCYDWEVGTHGIKIHFSDGRHQYAATYLPVVAVQFGWSREKTIRNLVEKAGYHGKVTQGLLSGMWVVRYQASVAHCTFEDYNRHNQVVAAVGVAPHSQTQGDHHRTGMGSVADTP
eukprot:TRINITY_DN14273_c0_g1_i1.p1 TRINITY_DN14273_c0_g1~~TRINITY_DN14273_c0_g1_i1.p1  ORF type:complete len:249 (+),score=35.41 TRINITY_DN14273_c0_g1_i1:30-749(+)